MIHDKSDGARRRVLVVDDERDAATTWAVLLRKWGFDAEVAHDGQTALQAAAEKPPDAVLLDIGLPGMNGWTLASKLWPVGSENRPFVVVVSGYGTAEDKRKSAEAGVEVHLLKPVDVTELLNILGTVQGRRPDVG